MHVSSKQSRSFSFNSGAICYGFLLALSTLAVSSHAQGELELVIEKLDSRVNTDLYHESSPVISLDGKYLYFTRTGSPEFERTLISGDHDLSQTLDEQEYKATLASIFTQIGNSEVVDPVGSPFNQDIWVASLDEGEIQKVFHPGWPLNSALPNSVVSASYDSNSLVVINQFYSDGSMYEGFSLVERHSNQYGVPNPMHVYDFYNNSEEANVALSRNGLIAIFSLERSDSKGGNDLYLSFKVKDGLWGTPKPLADNVNSKFRESNPYITNNGRQLYFTSDRPGTLGGMDIWVCDRLDYTWTRWTDPVRLEAPINSPWDDSQGCIDDKGDFFYFTSKRDGSSDIYRASVLKHGELEEPLNMEIVAVEGDSDKPIRAEIYCKPMSSKNYLEYFHTYNGKYYTVFTEYETYEIFARKSGHQPVKVWFDAVEADTMDIDTHRVVLRLYPGAASNGTNFQQRAEAIPETTVRDFGERQPINTLTGDTSFTSVSVKAVEPKETIPAAQYQPADTTPNAISEQIGTLKVGQRLSFFNIYFRRTTPVVLRESYPALDQLVEGLSTNPTVKIRVEGHTDNRGNEKDLMELSWQRAEAIKTYLVLKGIDPKRISTVGFGAQKPIAPNYDELNRSRNRRVEIRILAR